MMMTIIYNSNNNNNNNNNSYFRKTTYRMIVWYRILCTVRIWNWVREGASACQVENRAAPSDVFRGPKKPLRPWHLCRNLVEGARVGHEMPIKGGPQNLRRVSGDATKWNKYIRHAILLTAKNGWTWYVHEFSERGFGNVFLSFMEICPGVFGNAWPPLKSLTSMLSPFRIWVFPTKLLNP